MWWSSTGLKLHNTMANCWYCSVLSFKRIQYHRVQVSGKKMSNDKVFAGSVAVNLSKEKPGVTRVTQQQLPSLNCGFKFRCVQSEKKFSTCHFKGRQNSLPASG